MTPEEFNEAARRAQEYQEKYKVSHRATAADVQKALHLITAVAGFDVDAMAQEYIRKGRESLRKALAEHPGLYEREASQHGFHFRRGEAERLFLSWDYENDTAEITLEQILPGEILARGENTWEFSLSEFAEFVASGQDPVARIEQQPAPHL